MRVGRVEWAAFDLPFRAPLPTAHGVETRRRGLIVRIRLEAGPSGLGEASPLPSFNGEALATARLALAAAGPKLAGSTVEDALARLAELPSAAARFGVETALLDAWGRLAGVSVADLLVSGWPDGQRLTPSANRRGVESQPPARPGSGAHPGAAGETVPGPRAGESADTAPDRRAGALAEAAPDRRASGAVGAEPGGRPSAVADAVPVNATIGGAGRREAVAAALLAVEAGFRTVKLKVGLAASVADEVERVAAVRAAIGPTVRLRLDANEAWEVDRAVEVLRACARLDVELVEQPVRADDLAGLAAVRRAVEIPVAADEAVRDDAAARAILAADAADFLIVKPTIVGGLRAGSRIAALARAAGREAIVTTTLESGVGIVACLHLAASLAPAAGASRAHGLATGPLLETDLLATRLVIRDGQIARPRGPGLAVELDPDAVGRWTSARDRGVATC